MRLIDTHLHFWDLRRDDLRYPWLQPGVPHPILGDIDAVKAPLYDPEAFIAETRFAGVERAVHVEADAEAATPHAEPAWVRSVARQAGLATAIVADLDLAAASGPEDVRSFFAHGDVRGVRDFGVVDYLQDPAGAAGFHASLDAMEAGGLLLDLDCAFEHMGRARALAEAHPGLTIVLEHIGYPRSHDDAYFKDWSPAVRRLAGAPNVHCKLSGLGMLDRRFTPGSLRRWVDTCLDAFGPGRCMFGSNWPLDRMASSYDALVEVFGELIAGCTAAEQEAICFDNAEGVYFARRPLAGAEA
jgi:predicted TIM-barrel fold metal-dependent hydrolase